MIDGVVRRAAARWGDHPALVEPGGRTTSVRDLDRRSQELASELARRSIGEGTVVGLCLPSGREYYVACLALARLGAVAAGTNPLLPGRERSDMVAAVGASHVLATQRAAEGLPADIEVHEVVAEGGADDGLVGTRASSSTPPRIAPDPDRPVAIVFTSGSTGTPKGATFAAAQMSAALEVERSDPWSAGRHILSGTQFPHVGFMLRYPGYLEMGTTLVVQDRWSASGALDAIERYRMPAVNGVPAQLALMAREPEVRERDLSCVERIVTGGGPSSPALIRTITELFEAPFTTRYSLTESGGVGTATGLDGDDEELSETVGRPRAGMRLRISGEPSRPGEVGEIQLSGPTVMSGYWGAPAATAELLRSGWLSTGDLGYVDDRGLLRLAGRTKEMFVRGGYNVHPQEVEAALADHPGVADVVIVPRPDEVMGEIGVAVVMPRGGTPPPSLAQLRDFGATRLPRYKLPEAMQLVSAMPLTSMNKVDRRALRASVGDASAIDEFLHSRQG